MAISCHRELFSEADVKFVFGRFLKKRMGLKKSKVFTVKNDKNFSNVCPVFIPKNAPKNWEIIIRFEKFYAVFSLRPCEKLIELYLINFSKFHNFHNTIWFNSIQFNSIQNELQSTYPIIWYSIWYPMTRKY